MERVQEAKRAVEERVREYLEVHTMYSELQLEQGEITQQQHAEELSELNKNCKNVLSTVAVLSSGYKEDFHESVVDLMVAHIRASIAQLP